MKKLLIVAALPLILGACAAQSLYSWDSYDRKLYDYYKDPASEATFRTKLEAHLTAVKSAGARPAPGLYAELGTLYLKSGDQKKAIQYYQLEGSTWPESQLLMKMLVTNLDKPATGDKK